MKPLRLFSISVNLFITYQHQPHTHTQKTAFQIIEMEKKVRVSVRSSAKYIPHGDVACSYMSILRLYL